MLTFPSQDQAVKALADRLEAVYAARRALPKNVAPECDYVVTTIPGDDDLLLVTPSERCNAFFHNGNVHSFTIQADSLGAWRSIMLGKMRTVRLA